MCCAFSQNTMDTLSFFHTPNTRWGNEVFFSLFSPYLASFQSFFLLLLLLNEMEFWFQLINHHLLKLTPSCRQHHRKIMAVLRFAMPAMLLTLFYKRKLQRISKMFIGFVVSKSRTILLVFLDSDGWSRHRQRRVDFQDFGCFKVKTIFLLRIILESWW